MQDEAKSKAKEMADSIIQDAKKVIETEKQNALKDVKNTVANLSLEIAEKILKKELESDASQQKYINDLIKEVNNSKS